MVMTAAWANTLAPASVAYTFSETSSIGALRENEECWFPLNSITRLGWKVRSTGDLVDLDAEGRLIKVPSRVIEGTRMVSLSEATRQIGAVARWEDGTYRILGQVRSIDFIGGTLRLDSTLSFRVTLSQLANPNRLVIDLKGVALPEDNRYRFPKEVRAGQYKPDTLRIVIDDPAVALPRTTRPGALRFLDLNLAPYRFQETIVVEPSFSPGGMGQSGQTPLNPGDLASPPPQNSATLIPLPPAAADVLSATIKENNARSETLVLATSNPVRPQPVVAYETATTILLTASAKTASSLNVNSLKGKFVESVEIKNLSPQQVQFRIKTKRPVTFELSASGAAIVLRLNQPKNSDGKLAGKTIVLDAGHGGPDSGATWPTSGKPSLMEKSLALLMARLVSTELSELGANIIMTRNTDVRIPLKDRSEVANDNNAALFVSIHFNSSAAANKQTGTMTFYHMRDPEGMLLAKCIQDEIAKVAGLKNHGTISDSRIYSTGFAVLRYSAVPSVLLELAFINHSTDRAAITQANWQQRVANAIAKGIQVYLGNVKETPNP